MELTGIDLNFYYKILPAFVANAGLILYVLLKPLLLRRYLLFFSVTTLLDITVAGQLLPLANPNLQTALEYLFVLVGDLRFILPLSYILYAGKSLADIAKLRPGWDVLRPALIFTIFPSLIVSAIGFARPAWLTEPRQKFLAYEVTFFLLTLLWIYVVMPQRAIAERERIFLRSIAAPVLAFYGLWSVADILILQGITIGYAVRILPNFLYYCVFLWWASWAAERSRRYG